MNNIACSGITLDSRTVSKGNVFIAVQGETLDGRDFILDAIMRGAVAVITDPLSQQTLEKIQNSESFKKKTLPIVPFAHLQSSIGHIAARFYHNPSAKMPVIGVTGTNGKTSCSHFIAQLAQHMQKKCAVIGTLGAGFLPTLIPFELTTPDAVSVQAWLSKLQQQQASFVAMEVTSHALSQSRVAGVQFHTAIFTNLTHDHLDYYKNFSDYFQAKERLFTEYEPKNSILNLDCPYGQTLAEKLIKLKKTKMSSSSPFIVGITLEDKNPMNAVHSDKIEHLILTRKLQKRDSGFSAIIESPWGVGELYCPLLGTFNLSNVLAVLAALCLQDIPFEEILSHLPKLKPVSGRMNHLGGGKNEPSVVIDYAHTPDALAKVLTALRPHCQGKIWCIFGCGGERDPLKRPLMANVAEKYSDYIIVTQDNPRSEDPEAIIADILTGFSQNGFSHTATKNIQVEPDRAKAIHSAILNAHAEDLIVIAGKGHETHQIIQNNKIPFVDENHAIQALYLRSHS